VRLDIDPEARLEFLSASARYESEVPGLGARFIAEFERGVRLLLDSPRLGAPFGRRLRRLVLNDGFPYSIVYTVRSDVLLIIAVAHGSRRPGSGAIALLANKALERTVNDKVPRRVSRTAAAQRQR
jgi:toxin ParE1/3/4